MFGNSDEFKYDKEKTFEQRLDEANNVLSKYPDRIPILVEKSSSCKKDIPDIDKSKFLVPSDLTVGQFMYVIRKRLKLQPDEAIFLFMKGMTPSNTALITSLYEEYKDKDKWLRISYTGENTFG